MQSKQSKYEAAVQRNQYRIPQHASRSGATLEEVKTKIGIRATDTRFDNAIDSVIKTETLKQEKKKNK